MVDQCWLYLAGQHHVPVCTFPFDGAGFGLPLRCVDLLALGELDFERANLGQADAVVFRERKARLRIGETLILSRALVTRIPRSLPCFHALEETLEGFVQAA